MAGRNDNPSTPSEMTWFIVVVVIGGALVLLWLFAKTPIVLTTFAINWLQVKAWQLVFGLGERGLSYLDFIESFFDGRNDPMYIKWSEFTQAASTIGSVVQIPMALLIASLGVVTIFRMKGDGFKRVYDLAGAMKFQASHWRTLTPSSLFEPDKKEKAMLPAKRPVDWLHEIGVKARLTSGGTLDEEARAKCEKAFIKQLGPTWAPLPKLKVHVRCLVAMCAVHHAKTKNALSLREDIAVIWATENDPAKRDAKLEALIKPVLENEKLMEPMMEFTERHGYVATALMAMLKKSRARSGVLAPAEFLWLKRVDRPLWYALNNVGRHAFHVEAGGTFSHYFHEQVVRRAILEPKVNKAIEGLEDYLEAQGISEVD